MSIADITIVITTFQGKSKIKKCLNSINKSCYVINVENSDDEEFKRYIEKEFSNVKCILTGKNLGYAAGHNFGLKNVKTKYVLILNPDLICKENYFKNIQRYLNNESDYSIIGSQYEESKMNKPAYGLFNVKTNNNDLPVNENYLQKVDWVVGCSMLINLEKFNTKNLFDENFFLFF